MKRKRRKKNMYREGRKEGTENTEQKGSEKEVWNKEGTKE